MTAVLTRGNRFIQLPRGECGECRWGGVDSGWRRSHVNVMRSVDKGKADGSGAAGKCREGGAVTGAGP